MIIKQNYPVNFIKLIIFYSIIIGLVFNFDFLIEINNYFLNSKSFIVFQIFFNFLVSISLIFFISLFLIFFGTRYLLKPLIIILLTAGTVITYYKKTYGITVDQGIIESLIDAIIEKNFVEINDLLSLRLAIYVIIGSIIPSIPLFFIKIIYPTLLKEYFYRIGFVLGILLILAILIFSSYKDTSLTVRATRGINKSIIPHYSMTSLFKTVKNKFRGETTYTILDKNPKIENESEEILGIVVVGETARADRQSLNGYSRKTNPLLEKQEIVNYKNAYACGTLTKISVPCMFFLGDYTKFSEQKAKYQQNLLSVVEKAGVETIWIENNSSCKSVCDRGTKKIDIITDQNNTYDEILLKITEDLILNNNVELKNINFEKNRSDNLKSYLTFKQSDKKRSLIILHIMGSHGPKYYKRYPEIFDKFKPSCKKNTPQDCTLEELSNAFDNTILYTDYILDSLIKILKKQNKQSFLIYASDHGESLGEYGLYLHGAPLSIAPKEQTHIPWLMWFSEKYKKNNNIEFLNNDEKITHEYFPHTILDALKIKTTLFKKNKSLILSNQYSN